MLLPLKNAVEPTKQYGTLSDYIAIARLDHATKHIFIIPGAIIAFMLTKPHNDMLIKHVFLGLICAACIASANYVINEYLDRDFDRHHPTKSKRAAVQRELSGRWITVEWLCLLAVGLTCAGLSSRLLLVIAIAFAAQGVVYNVRPMRTKDLPYLDVISESINNPLRLMIGWAMISATTLPPVSFIFAYWFGGAFLMAAKRLSEYREIVAKNGRDLLVRYRASFRFYSETSLTVSCFIYGLLSTFFLAIFLIKYRIEYLIMMPLIFLMFAQYLALSMQFGSSAQNPEKLFRERGLIATAAALAVVFIMATFIELPMLSVFIGQRFIALK